MKILAIETSCDETSIAIIEASGARESAHFRVLSHIISSQVKIHEKYGGVVPNLAKREHQKNLPMILLKTFKESRFLISKSQFQISKQISKSKLQKIEKILEREPALWERFRKHIIPLEKPPIDMLAVTVGPGLEPALWVGINFTKALSVLWNIPVIPVDHMEGHVFSALLEKRGKDNFKIFPPSIQKKFKIKDGWIPLSNNHKINKVDHGTNFQFPMLALLVSGGHTELVLVKAFDKYKIVGETLDDAAGEAFDKTARLLGLGYPGGPEISRLASQNVQDRVLISLPRPMIHSHNLNFSFSGLKTAVLYLIRDLENPSINSGQAKYDIKKLRPVIAKEFQDAVIEVLITKTTNAAKKYRVKTILLAGGVSANKLLRERLTQAAKLSKVRLLTAPLELTGDNALMIGIAAFFNQKKATKKLSSLKAEGNKRLSSY